MKLATYISLSCVLALSICSTLFAQTVTGVSNGLQYISPGRESADVGIAGADPADIALYLLARGAGTTKLSPDAKHVAFIYTITGERQLWVMPTTGGRAQQLTFGNGITFFEWSPDSGHLIYGSDNNGNEQESYFLISADGKKGREVLPAVSGGFRVFGAFSTSTSRFAYASTERNGLDFDIYIGDTVTGNSKRIYQGKYGFFVTAVSPDGTLIAIRETVGEDSDNLYLLDTKTGLLNTVSKPKIRANHSDGGVVFSHDGKSLYIASNVEREYTALLRYDIPDSSFSTMYEADVNVENVTLCGKDDQYILWTSNHNGFDQLHAIKRSNGRRLTPPEIAEGKYSLSCSTQSERVIVNINGWQTPGDIVSWNLKNGRAETLFESSYAGLDKDRLIRPQSITIPARDGVQLQGLLYMPDEKSVAQNKLPPIVFEVHGGPTAQATAVYNGPIQYLLDRGIAVFQPNVRGSAGFSRSYTTLDDKEKRGDSVRDLIDMLLYLKEDGKIDTKRAAVAGGSYGGYMVNAVLAEYPEYFKAGVSRYGVADWVTALEVASPALKASDIIEYGDIRDTQWQEFYKQNSPINIAHKVRVPVLYSHGVMDPRIDISETETMVRALRDNNVKATYIRIADEGHGWRKRSNQLFYYRRQAQFLEEHLIFQ